MKSQVKSSQVKASQVKSSQVKSSRNENFACEPLNLRTRFTPHHVLAIT